MGNATTTDYAPEGVTTDIGRFAIVPLWLLRRCNAIQNGTAALSVFIALHEWADRDRPCFPSVASIAEVAGVSAPTAKRGIAALVDIGALTVTPRWIEGTRERTSSSYRMHSSEPTSNQIRPNPSGQIRANPSGQIRASNKNNLEQEQTELDNTSTLTHDTTSLPAQRHESETETFDAFWSRYPRKVGKGAAQSRWRKLSPVERSAVMVALPEHVARWREMRTETQFIPHPATWLSQQRWEDQLATDARREMSMPSAVRHAADLLARLENSAPSASPTLSYAELEQAYEAEAWE